MGANCRETAMRSLFELWFKKTNRSLWDWTANDKKVNWRAFSNRKHFATTMICKSVLQALRGQLRWPKKIPFDIVQQNFIGYKISLFHFLFGNRSLFMETMSFFNLVMKSDGKRKVSVFYFAKCTGFYWFILSMT